MQEVAEEMLELLKARIIMKLVVVVVDLL